MYTMLPIANEIDQRERDLISGRELNDLPYTSPETFTRPTLRRRLGNTQVYLTDKRDKKQQEGQQDVATFFSPVLHAHAPLRRDAARESRGRHAKRRKINFFFVGVLISRLVALLHSGHPFKILHCTNTAYSE